MHIRSARRVMAVLALALIASGFVSWGPAAPAQAVPLPPLPVAGSDPYADIYVISQYLVGPAKRIPAGGTASSMGIPMQEPYQLTRTPSGVIYIAEYASGQPGAGSIERIAADGTRSTFLGNLTASMAVNVDSTGAVYAGGAGWLMKVAGGVQTPITVPGGVVAYGIAIDPNDNAYVTDKIRNRIIKVTSDGTVSVYATGITAPMAVEAGADGVLYVSTNGLRIQKITPGGVVSEFAKLSSPALDLALDGRGNLFAADPQAGAVIKFPPTFAGGYLPGPAVVTGLGWPTGIAVVSTPPPPATVTGTPGASKVAVSWTASATYSGAAVTDYKVTSNPESKTCTTNGALTCDVAGLSPTQGYTFTVQASNDHGTTWSEPSPPSSLAAPLTLTAPAAPASLTVTPANGGLDLSFPPAADGGSAIQRYEVSVGAGNWTTLPTSGTNPLTATVGNLTNGISYGIGVRAVNAVGDGAVVTGSGIPRTVPGAPVLQSATRGDGSADLVIAPPLDDGGNGVSGYEYTTGGSWNALTTSAGSGGTRTATITALANGTSYGVKVRALNLAGPGADSNALTVTPATTPRKPTQLVATRGDTALDLSFLPPGDVGGDAITRYDVSTDDGSHWSTMSTTAGTGGTRTGTIGGLINGTTYPVRVRAANTVGDGAASDAITGVPATTPAAPTGLSVSPGTGAVTVTFTPGVTGGDPVTRYEVSTGSAGWATLPTASGTGGTLTGSFGGLVPGTIYPVRVRAVNGVGDGAASAAVNGSPSPVVPGAPTGLSAAAASAAAAVTFTPPSSDGGMPIYGYEYTVDNGTSWKPLPTAAGAGGTRTGRVPGLSNNVAYTVMLRARNDVGPGDASAGASVTPAAVPPGAPAGVTAVRGAGAVSLTVTPPTNTGSDPVTAYEWTIDDGSSWHTLTTAPSRTGTVTGLTNGTAYTFKVRARTGSGPGPAGAGVSATPATTPDAPTVSSVASLAGGLEVAFTPGATGGDPITGYEISTDDGDSWRPLPATAGVGSVGNLTNGTTYQVRLRAVNGVGPGAGSSARPGTPSTVPGAPEIRAAESRNRGATISFRPGPDGGAEVTGYEVSSSDSWAPVTTNAGIGGTRVATVAGLDNGTTYAFRLRAVNGSGPGAGSDPVEVTAGRPPAPAAVVATAGTSSLDVTWTPPADNGVTVTGYVVYAAPGDTACEVTAATRHCVLGAVAGTRYTAVVVALGGNVPSPPALSNEVIPTAPLVPAGPPTTRLLLTTDKGDITTAAPGENIVVIGKGFAPRSTVRITIYSDPIVLGLAVTDADGAFRKAVSVPASLGTGQHSFVATGVDRHGKPRAMKLVVSVGAALLPITGGTPLAHVLAGLCWLLAGISLCSAAWWLGRPWS
ncbi:hypothetical protein HH310_10555 [Actinoplanes sp. TBRC 11911]|uniref:fibronectin type III domain-containing protein n=1 Tax=Actinoplanes sp. TBRC 11911 TaxID=2729386 RepID=UPI00145E35CE|nr:fibronectin type III domain-containing protein [Actinoplanes sp. TBRC 11911]NMO51630.1 hypothetical protein [Actinoplanes sp. TBRC 11911]